MQTKERKTWLVYVNLGWGWKLAERTGYQERIEEIAGRVKSLRGVGVKVKELEWCVPGMRMNYGTTGRVDKSFDTTETSFELDTPPDDANNMWFRGVD